jgi:Family of unknown function (DUF6499)
VPLFSILSDCRKNKLRVFEHWCTLAPDHDQMRRLDITRLPAAYHYLAELDPSGWAWEFLRRNPDYRADAAKLLAQPETAHLSDGSERHWGLQSPGGPKPPRR